MLKQLLLPSVLIATASGIESVRPYNKAVDNGTYGDYPIRAYATEEILTSPQVNWLQWSPECDDGRLHFITPRGGEVTRPGPMILDAQGDLVWTHWYANDWGGQTYNFQVQQYQGEDYLTFWLGDDNIKGHGEGVYYMLNSSYDVVHKVEARGGLAADLHEFVITPQGTALLTVYEIVPYNLTELRASDWSDRPSSRPGEEDWNRNYVYDCLIQEVDIETGDLLFEWRATDHIDVMDTYHHIEDRGGHEWAFDWIHINSISKDELGNFLVSARYTHSVVYIDGQTGKILWTLGGRRNQFMDLSGGEGLNFAWQHDARFHVADAFPEIYTPPAEEAGLKRVLLTMFDNAAEDQHYDFGPDAARGLLLEVTYPTALDYHKLAKNAPEEGLTADQEKVAIINGTDPRYTVRVVQSYSSPGHTRSSSQGSVQVLPPRHGERNKLLVGFGLNAMWAEFDTNGTVLCDVHFGPTSTWEVGSIQSYRTYKFPWVGKPHTPPKIMLSDDGLDLYMSWNGATEVKSWLVQGAKKADQGSWTELARVAKKGFENVVDLAETGADSMRFLRVVALDAAGHAIEYGTSEAVDTEALPAVYEQGGSNDPVEIDDDLPFNGILVFIFAVVGSLGAYDLMKRWQSSRVGKQAAGRFRWRKGLRYNILHGEA